MISQIFMHFPEYLLIIDFEATCDEKNIEFQHEIIEFPIVVMNRKNGDIFPREKWFHRYIKPVERPTLTKFCIELTGIKQTDVNNGVLLSKAINEVHQYLYDLKLVENENIDYYYNFKEENFNFAFYTDGPWDFQKFLWQEARRKNISLPCYFWKYSDIRGTFRRLNGKFQGGVCGMLKHYGLDFEGSMHSGIDDSYNIARICQEMLKQKPNIVFSMWSLKIWIRQIRKRVQYRMNDFGKLDYRYLGFVHYEIIVSKQHLNLFSLRILDTKRKNKLIEHFIVKKEICPSDFAKLFQRWSKSQKPFQQTKEKYPISIVFLSRDQQQEFTALFPEDSELHPTLTHSSSFETLCNHENVYFPKYEKTLKYQICKIFKFSQTQIKNPDDSFLLNLFQKKVLCHT